MTIYHSNEFEKQKITVLILSCKNTTLCKPRKIDFASFLASKKLNLKMHKMVYRED